MTDSRYIADFGPIVAPWGDPMFCGPCVLSAITGRSVLEIERLVLKHRCEDPSLHPDRDLSAVEGMNTSETRRVLEAYGYVWVDVYPGYIAHFDKEHNPTHTTEPTFIRWLRETRETRGDDVYLVTTASHIIAVKGDWIVDNLLELPHRYEEEKHYRRCRVREVICVLKDDK